MTLRIRQYIVGEFTYFYLHLHKKTHPTKPDTRKLILS